MQQAAATSYRRRRDARELIIVGARREHRLQIIDPRIAGDQRRSVAQRDQHVAIATDVAERRGLIDQRPGIVGIGGKRRVVPAQRGAQPLLGADEIGLQRQRGAVRSIEFDRIVGRIAGALDIGIGIAEARDIDPQHRIAR